MAPAFVEPRSPVASAVARTTRASMDTWMLTKELPWPCSRGSVASLLPSLVAMELHLASVASAAGHIGLCFRYADPLGDEEHGRCPYDIVLVVDAIPEPKFDQAFQLELLQELANDTSTESFVAANTDMLLSRHNASVVHMAFLRTPFPSSPSASTLRCLVARADGRAYVWEWASDKVAWIYLNVFSFAPSPPPALVFTTFPAFGGQHGLAWWAPAEPVAFRNVGFEAVPSLAKHPTHMLVGNPLSLAVVATHPVQLFGSALGLWIIADDAVLLKSARSPETLSTPAPGNSIVCVHDLTGALIILSPTSRALHIVQEVKGRLVRTPLPYALADGDGIGALACHRQFLLAATTNTVAIYDVHSGAAVATLALPAADGGYRFWGGTVATGVFASHAFYRLKVPSATAYADELAPREAHRHLADHGPSLAFAQVARAYSELRAVGGRALVVRPEFDVVGRHLEHPALLLALLEDAKAPAALVRDLRRRLAAMQLHVKHTLRAVPDAAVAEVPLRHTTPVNLDTAAHLHAWLELNGARDALLSDCSYLDRVRSPAVRAMPVAAVATPLAVSRHLHALSPLQFASWACSAQFGPGFLAQLEALLLEGVVFKAGPPTGVPSHLLFHEERKLADYRRTAATKQLYFEAMARLYAAHEPAALAPFVACVAQYCPRLFSLHGQHLVPTRTHSDRALLALPPVPSTANVVAYADVLSQTGAHLEAAALLLRHDHYDACVAHYDAATDAVRPLLFWQLLEHCVAHLPPTGSRNFDDVLALVQRRPTAVAPALVLRKLKECLTSAPGVTLGQLRPVIAWLIAQQT
ncbi:hypothetical protein ACHHYP_16104 [Achlya hypogyna]|uniref:Uncharacterized protein n=1 Tax=Achlya hypogyna TaxID=1202772 RepID=A0A1V9ZE95_ACHHY|nr:hypothetical protein ACHHYP_16104 [Achlya hypogyna]